MELNTEINKVFGQEMAKIFAASIDEEEMQKKAQEVWKNLNSTTDGWGSKKNSDLENMVKQVLIDNIHAKILTILKEPENDEAFEKRAREMVEKARNIAEEAIIKQLAENIAARTTDVYNDYHNIVYQVMRELNSQSENSRRY